MSSMELRRRIKRKLDALPPDRLQSVADFVSFVARERESKKASEDPRKARLRQAIREADAAAAAGRLIPYEKLRLKR